ncbi:carboxypeptidase-like regulatory domain-containing protein [Mucilaginibacter terrae]|uniref:carboxypeptidase-like regulatory domain-containing protein n=1 Tax=Mucilaginibacter terrae TaxID=1955052 RepID=UPI00362B414B
MLNLLLPLLLIAPLASNAQYNISGKVINLYDKKPVVKASVFLSNTTVGSISNEDGSYLLNNVKPGQYDMVISAIGYETSYQTIKVDKNIIIAYSELNPKSIDLKAVVVKPDMDWQQNYNIFKREFFGSSPYADQCKILNPETLNLLYDKAKRRFIASSNDYLEIENKALGYRVKYFLTELEKDYNQGSLYYQGNVLFTSMQGKPSQMKRWQKNRLEAYLGSSEHYFRSIIGHQLADQGFKTLPLIRKPNPERPPDSLIQAKLKTFRSAALANGNHYVIQKNDSLNYWSEKNRMPKYTDYLVTKPLRVDSLVKRTDQKGIYALGYNEIMYIIYTKKKGNNMLYNRPMSAPDNPTSLINFIDKYAFFDSNGVITNPKAIIYEGNWGNNRAANLLPVDYDPHQKQ